MDENDAAPGGRLFSGERFPSTRKSAVRRWCAAAPEARAGPFQEPPCPLVMLGEKNQSGNSEDPALNKRHRPEYRAHDNQKPSQGQTKTRRHLVNELEHALLSVYQPPYL